MSRQVIGMLHVPINAVLAGPVSWRAALGLPSPTGNDWTFLSRLPKDIVSLCDKSLLDEVEKFSIWPFLEDRILTETELYERNGVDAVILENTGAPYFVRGSQPPIIYWVMRALAERLKAEYPTLQVGIQILAYSDDWAMDIACRCGLDFIRCESALFDGVRPEGRMPNSGNLAKLYMTRNMLMSQLEKEGPGPQVYVDLHKKHTSFIPGLDTLDLWLENIMFQKLEGIIITGSATGKPPEENDLLQAREAIEKTKADSLRAVGMSWAPPLIVGSGASIDNIAVCKQYADTVIVGSSLKRNGYWECALDEERVKRFMEAWNK